MPHLAMPGSVFYCLAQKPDYNAIAMNDVCVVQRCCTKGQYEFLQVVSQLGLKIVYDLDDNVWELPDYNPAANVLNANREGFNACIRMVDVVSVSTRTLAKAVRKHVKFMVHAHTGKEIPIMVAENRIYEDMFVDPVQPEGLVVGWAGSSSHIGDLGLVEEALVSVGTEFPTTVVEFRGCEPAADSRFLKLPNFRFKMWTPVAEYGARMPLWGWSIALAPVTDHDFNASKSCIKMIEAAYCGIPCLASWVQPYDEFCSWDKELRWLLCAGSSNWTKKLRELVCDEARRVDLGRRMKKVMAERYSWNREHEGWAQVMAVARGL